MSDPDLEFLVNVENDDLKPLVLYIINSHESPRFNERLTFQDAYKKDPRNYRGYIREAIHELQLYGGNTLANKIRGDLNLAAQLEAGAFTALRSSYAALRTGQLHATLSKRFQSAVKGLSPRAIFGSTARLPLLFGRSIEKAIENAKQGVPYRELLRSVCGRLGFKTARRTSVMSMEHFVFIAVLDNSTRGMDETQLAAVIREFQPQVKIPDRKQALTAAAQAAIRSAGFEPYKLAVIVANAAAKQVLGKGLSFGLNALLTESISVFAGPVGIALTTFWAANSLLFGEAYRVIIPACVHVGYLRLKYGNAGVK